MQGQSNDARGEVDMGQDQGPEKEAFEVSRADATGGFLITCDHASNRVPDWVGGGDLGLAPADMERHIAYDIGAAGVARHLSELLSAPAILSRFSRLVIDPNRGEDDPTLIMQLYDGTVIEGNRSLDEAERERRLERLYRPYHRAIAQQLDRHPAAYVAIHSFTPQLSGRPKRPWHVTVLAAEDRRFSDRLLPKIEAEPDLVTALNEPYIGALHGDAVDRHALRRGLLNVLIELRHDLIATPADQRRWAERLAPMLASARAEICSNGSAGSCG
jgi:predicted N-formylglutamate amidohydrolase